MILISIVSCTFFKATSKPVAVGFGISKPEHVKKVSLNTNLLTICIGGAAIEAKNALWSLLIEHGLCLLQVVAWGADGVIVGSAMVKLLGEAKSPEEGLKELETLTKSLKSALL